MKAEKGMKVEMVARHRYLRNTHGLVISGKVGSMEAELCKALHQTAHSQNETMEVDVTASGMHLKCKQGTVIVASDSELKSTLAQTIRHRGLMVKLYKYKDMRGIILLPNM